MESCCEGLFEQGPPRLEFLVLLTTGLMMSLGHCIGMCGPIVAAFSASQRRPDQTGVQLLPALLLYHFGRLTSYMMIGAFFGLLGSTTLYLGPRVALQGGLSITVGVLMALLGLGLLGWLPTLSWVEHRGLTKAVSCRIGELLRAERWYQRISLGIANGFLPCGPVIAIALGAATTKQPFLGAMVMLAYGLGTLPVLLTLGYGTSWLSPGLRKHLYRIGAVLVFLIGAQLALRGMAAFGWIGHVELGSVVLY